MIESFGKSVLLWMLFVILAFIVNPLLQAQNSFPALPPKDVSAQMDRDQMLWQLGIKLPQLPPKAEDPNRPEGIWPADKSNPEGNWTNDKKYTITRSAFGLWNNYSDKSAGFFPGPDSARIGNYTPIDLLRMHDGRIISTPEEWWNQRRPEVLRDLQEHLYGFIPPDSILPRVDWKVTASSGGRGSGAWIQKEITGIIDISRYPDVRNRPVISATLRTPSNASGAVPVVIIFGGFGNIIETYWERAWPEGWGVCIFNLTMLQPDNGIGLTSYLIGLVNKGNWRKPGDWGTLAAWSWGVSRLIDYFETDKSVNSSMIGLSGHSRYGKATLVTMAFEPRIAIGFPSDAGSLGTKLNRRHWGQDLENSTGPNEYHWMAGNFFKWAGEKIPGNYLPRKIEDCPVDAHSLFALCAPRPVLVNAGTSSSWTDPYGMYLAVYNASPVYELLGSQGIVMNDAKPVVDKAYTAGKLAYRYHNGGHTDAPDWPAFFDLASGNFVVSYLNVSVPSLTLGASDNLSASFRVSSDSNFKVSRKGLWLKSTGKSFSQNDTVTLIAKVNKKDARSASLIISGTERKQKVIVSQAAMNPRLSVSPEEIRVGEKEGSTASFDILTNSAWNISSGARWLKVAEETGIMDKTVLVGASVNPLVQERSVVLTISSPGLPDRTVNVIQAAGAPALNVSAEKITFPGSGGASSPVIITSNTPWSLTCSAQWVTSDASTGEGFKQLTLKALENFDASERKAEITITVSDSLRRVIIVTQKGR